MSFFGRLIIRLYFFLLTVIIIDQYNKSKFPETRQNAMNFHPFLPTIKLIHNLKEHYIHQMIVDNSVSSGLIGGLLIAISITLNVIFNGNITGLSGIFSSLLDFSPNNRFQSCFSAGFIMAAFYMQHSLQFFKFDPKAYEVSLVGNLIGGFLVGFGTRVGGGCTSGHGICGIARLSPRSFVALGLFMLFGLISSTTFVR